MVGTGQAEFPRPEQLNQYMTGKRRMALNRLRIKHIPDNAFKKYSDITVSATN